MQNTVDLMKESTHKLSLLYRDYNDFVELIDCIIDNAKTIILLPKSYENNEDVARLVEEKNYKTVEFFDEYIENKRFVHLKSKINEIKITNLVLNHIVNNNDSYIIFIADTDYEVHFKDCFYQSIYLLDVNVSNISQPTRIDKIRSIMNDSKRSRSDYENCDFIVTDLEVELFIEKMENRNLDKFINDKVDTLLRNKDYEELKKYYMYIK